MFQFDNVKKIIFFSMGINCWDLQILLDRSLFFVFTFLLPVLHQELFVECRIQWEKNFSCGKGLKIWLLSKRTVLKVVCSLAWCEFYRSRLSNSYGAHWEKELFNNFFINIFLSKKYFCLRKRFFLFWYFASFSKSSD